MRWAQLRRRNCLHLIRHGSAVPPSPHRGRPGCLQIQKIFPQKGAVWQIQAAPSIDCKYSKATTYKFGLYVSGGAYQDARKVSIVWNDA